MTGLLLATSCDWSCAKCRVVIVSSGAVGVGAQRLGLKSRPSKLPQKQALAAVGQVHLMRFYDDFFSAIGLVSTREYPSLFCSCQASDAMHSVATTRPINASMLPNECIIPWKTSSQACI